VNCSVSSRVDGFAFVFLIVVGDELLVDPVEFCFRQFAEQVPAERERVVNRAVGVVPLLDELALEGIREVEILVVSFAEGFGPTMFTRSRRFSPSA